MAIRKVGKNDFVVLKKIAHEILEPLYGDQAKALNEWMTGAGDKHAFVSIHSDGAIAGFLSLKANPKRTYLKISTLVVLPEYKRNGHGKKIIQYAESFANNHGFENLIVTVSGAIQESVDFFIKNDFRVISEEKGKYQEGISEYTMQKEIVMKSLRFKRKYFEMVRSGRKTLEARINYPFVKEIKDGEVVKFFWEDKNVIVKIISVRTYQGFKDMINNEDTKKLVPGMGKKEALAEYENIYPEWKVKKYGGISIFEFDLKC